VALDAGSGLHAFFLTDSAKVVADMRVYVFADRILIDCLEWRRDGLIEGLDRYLVADDVELEALNQEIALVALEGPSSAEVLRAVVPEAELPEAPFSHCTTRFSGAPVMIAAVSEVGGSGFLVCGAAHLRDDLLDACRAAGAQALGGNALAALRLEAGVPWAGVDMDQDVLAMEMDMEAAFSFSKGCYLGQEVVERVAARGHVNRRRVGLRLDIAEVPECPGTIRVAGRDVGRITSAAHSYLLGQTVGLGIAQIKTLAEPEQSAVFGGREVACSVIELPMAEVASE
jgi:aminomethyltransferase